MKKTKLSKEQKDFQERLKAIKEKVEKIPFSQRVNIDMPEHKDDKEN